MSILTIINIALSNALLLWPIWFSVYILRLKTLNPFTILMCIWLPFDTMKLYGGPIVLIDEGLFNQGYQYAIFVNNLFTIMQIFGIIFFYQIFSKMKIDNIILNSQKILSEKHIYRCARFFFIIYIISMYQLISGEYGVINWLLNPREGYQHYRTGNGHWYALSISALSVSFLFFFLAKPVPLTLLKNTLIYIMLAYFMGSKGFILSICGAALVFLWFIRWRHINKLLILGAPFIFCLLIYNLYLALGDTFDLLAIVQYFDYYKNAAIYYNAILNNEIDLFYGEVFFSSFWSYVPRVLVPDKPFVYGVTLVNEIFFPGQAALTNTPSFGGAVQEFSDFGLIGVVFFGFFSSQSIIVALSSHVLFKNNIIDFNKINIGIIIILLIQYAPYFGSFLPAGLYLLLVASVYFSIITVKKLNF